MEEVKLRPYQEQSREAVEKEWQEGHKRTVTGLTTPKQIRCLEKKKYGFKHVGNWRFEEASDMISRLAANGWKVPRGINAHTYQPPSVTATDLDQYLGWDDIIPV